MIGRDQALRLIGMLPSSGSRAWRVCLYVPKRMSVDHPLVRILGYRDAERIRCHFGGEILQPSNCAYVPRLARDRSIRDLSREGASVSEVSEWIGLSEYRVLEILRGNPPEDADGVSDNPRLNGGGS